MIEFECGKAYHLEDRYIIYLNSDIDSKYYPMCLVVFYLQQGRIHLHRSVFPSTDYRKLL